VSRQMNGGGGLHVLMTADAVGGVWQYALDLAQGLSAYGVRTTLAVLGPAPHADQIASASAIPGCQPLPTGLPLDWTADAPGEVEAAGAAIAALAAQRRPDVVHLNSPALAAKTCFPAPVVGVCHSCVATWWEAAGSGAPPQDFVWRRSLVESGYRSADALIAPTSAFAQATAQTYGLRNPPIIVHNGRRPHLHGKGTGPENPFAFTAGRLWDKAKNVATLDRAAAHITIPVLAAGASRGPNGDFIELKAIHALGSLNDDAVRGYLGSQPIFVSVARYEPFGLAVLEAAQAGCALVLSDIPTFRELWSGAAEFVSPDDETALAAVIEGIAHNADRRGRLGAAARQRAQTYTVGAMTAGVMAVYRAILPRVAATLAEAAA
jgi:glycosyltransferase involved in cell wall biosynthesis